MFKRRNYSRYQNKSKRPAYTKGKYPMTKGRTASRYTLINTVQQVLKRNSELKYFDTVTSYAFTAAGTNVTNITVIPQGTTDTERIGDRLQISSIELRWLTITSTTNWAYGLQHGRIILVQWFPATTPTYNDIMSSTSSRALYNHDQRQMYKVWYDKTYTTAALTPKALTTGHVMIYPKKNNKVQFQNAGTTGTNRFFLLVQGDIVAATQDPNVVTYARVRFTDS